MRNKKMLIGLLFILSGLSLIASKLGYLQGINVFTILLTGYLLYIIIKSFKNFNIYGILIPLALLAVIYWDFIGIGGLSPWTLVWSALLISIGLSLIIKPKRKFKFFSRHDGNDGHSYWEGEGTIHIKSSFSECIRYLQGEEIERVRLESSFGAMKIYFDKLRLKGDELTINLEASFSGVELYVPKEWDLIRRADAIFGAVDEKNRFPGPKSNTVYLEGSITFAGVEVIYI